MRESTLQRMLVIRLDDVSAIPMDTVPVPLGQLASKAITSEAFICSELQADLWQFYKTPGPTTGWNPLASRHVVESLDSAYVFGRISLANRKRTELMIPTVQQGISLHS